ncbi:hypothetical protein FRC18_004785 [Serendipita sp. 400]|nr:hypothetical protein FRC18_004785 [Serendipita sp. 400]
MVLKDMATAICLLLPLLGATANAALTSQTQVWKNVVIGAGGFVPGIVFNPTKPNLAYLRTDIGGAYRSNGDAWVPLTDYANDTTWHDWGIESLATDPIQPNILYLAVGLYTNSWDGTNGSIIKSYDYGRTWTQRSMLPFKLGGNMPGRGPGERLAIDPKNNKILYFAARSGNGLWKSVDAGVTWNKVQNFPDVGTYIADPNDASGYNADITGVVWVTFDSSSSTPTGTKRIFVGVASLNKSNIFVSNDSGATWTSLPAFANNAYMAHKGVLSPAEKVLYVTFNNNAGPYDGTAGAVGKYNITSGTWTDITPSSGSYGFGGLAVDLQKPGTLMVAPLNQWWPDANLWRSLDGGATWSPIWELQWPNKKRYYTMDNSLTPYLGGPVADDDLSMKEIGWMIEALVIDPHDSNHWLYGTGATVAGGHDLLNWDSVHNVTIKSMAAGIEETAVLGLVSPPSGSHLLSVVGDIGGFNHVDFNKPSSGFTNPIFGTTTGIDFAGNKPASIVRVGSNNGQISSSSDGGVTWSPYSGGDAYSGGQVAYSANGDAIIWSANQGLVISKNGGAFTTIVGVPSGAVIAADKINGTVIYAASGSNFYVSTNTGSTWTSTSASGIASPVWIAASPYKAGELWLSGNTGIVHSADYGKTWNKLGMVSNAWRIAVGKPQQPNGPPVVYASGTIDGANALYRTDDAGVNWIMISDSNYGFGASSGLILAADPRIYKRVYVGTNGRGIFWTSDAW